MERAQEIKKAIKISKKISVNFAKRRSRVHSDALEINSFHRRALEGLCGRCRHININFSHKDGNDTAALGCAMGYSPRGLYRETSLGEKAVCEGYKEAVNKQTTN